MSFPLRIYNPTLPTRVTYRNLPHWEQDGVCAFVTMRFQDSIPARISEEYQQSKVQWLKEKGLSGEETWAELANVLPPTQFLRFQRFASRSYQQALDKGLGACLFKHPYLRAPFEDILHRKDGEQYHLADYVIMPNHVHLLIQPIGDRSLKAILSSIRRLSAREINRLCHRNGTLWQPEPFDHLVRSHNRFQHYRLYIALNPIRARLAESEYSHWRYE